MKKINKVSIILPVYNQCEYIGEAIESVLNQSYENIELIIVDDGSTDEIDNVLKKYFNNNKVKIIRTKNNGLPAALNIGLSNACGEFCTWTSADNILHQENIEKLHSALLNNSECGFAYSDYYVIDENGDGLANNKWRKSSRPFDDNSVYLNPHPTIKNLHNGDNFIGPSFLWRNEIVEVVGEYDKKLFAVEDYEYHLRCHMVTNFIHLPEKLYYYRVHKNTISEYVNKDSLESAMATGLYKDKLRRLLTLADEEHLEKSFLNSAFRSPYQYKLAVEKNIRHIKHLGMNGEQINKHKNNCVVYVANSADDNEINLMLGCVDIAIANGNKMYIELKQKLVNTGIRVIKVDNDLKLKLIHAAALRISEKYDLSI